MSLYSGTGGLDYGFHKNSDLFKIVFANDFSKEVCATYRKNISDHIYEGDISQFLYDCEKKIDLIIGGFPCPSWSLAGKRKGFADSRGQEFFNCLSAVIKYRPNFFVFENVKGLLSSKNGKSLEFMKDCFENLGYQFHVELITMSDYGVPQKRERVLLMGSNKADINPEEFVPTKNPTNKPLAKVLTEIAEVVPINSDHYPNHNLHTGTEKKLKWIKLLKEGENLADLSEEEIRRREVQFGYDPGPIPKTLMGYRRLKGDALAPTMMFGNTCLPIHPTENRSLSVREAATIQGFPLDFEFMGGISSQYKQVGNAVPPLFSMQLALRMKEVLTKS